MLMPRALPKGTNMTEHPGSAHIGNGSTTLAQRPSTGRDPGVSERIYDYIRAGRADQRGHSGARPTPPPSRP
jgi:hypothetical protein